MSKAFEKSRMATPPIQHHTSVRRGRLCDMDSVPVISGCLAVVYSAIVALQLSVIVFSLDLELKLLHSFGTIGESSLEHR